MAQMGEIYRHSTLTISAASGNGTNSGLFVSRDARHRKPCNLRLTMKEPLRTRDDERPPVFSIVRSVYAPAVRFDNPLSKRGWVLQEHILSKRLLIFTPHEIQWQCQSRMATETHPVMAEYDEDEDKESDAANADPVTAMRLLVTMPQAFAALSETLNLKPNAFDVWYGMVEQYNNRALTNLSDTFPAVAGLATLMHQYFTCTYGAGLWQEDLQTGLVWYIVRTHTFQDAGGEAVAKQYIAPSWSWASSFGQRVKFYRAEEKGEHRTAEGLRYLDWQFSYPPGALIPFGQTTSGVLTVQGRLRKIFLLPCLQPWYKTEHCRYYDTMWRALAVCPRSATTCGDIALDTFELHQTLLGRARHQTHLLPNSEASEASSTGEKYPAEILACAVRAIALLCQVVDSGTNRSIVAIVLRPLDPLHADGRNYHRVGLLFFNGPRRLFEHWSAPDQVVNIY